MSKMIAWLKNFPNTVYYLISLSVLTLFVWTFHFEEVGVILVLVFMGIFFLFSKDTFPTIPLLMNALFMVSQTNWSFEDAPLYIYLTPIVILLGMTIHLIKFKVKLKHKKMVFGILLMFIAMVFSTFNAKELSIHYFFYVSIGLLYCFIYLFYVNTFQKDHRKQLLELFFILGVLITLEVFIYYITVPDIAYAITHKTITLGWGISNYIATYLIMFISISFYFAKVSKTKVVYLFVALVQVVALLLTASRGGIVAFACLTPLLLFLLFFHQEKWWKSLVSLLVFSAIITLIVLTGLEEIKLIFTRFEDLLFDDTGRFDIYLDAIQKFKEHPLFGSGLFAREGLRDYNMFHNTFLHTLATLGLFGLAGLCVQLYMQFKIVVSDRKIASLFLGAALLGAHLHGMVDNVYYMPQFMIVMLVIVSVYESTPKEIT